MKKGPFVIGTDGSNDDGTKYYPIVVKCLGDESEGQSKLLAIPTCPESRIFVF